MGRTFQAHAAEHCQSINGPVAARRSVLDVVADFIYRGFAHSISAPRCSSMTRKPSNSRVGSMRAAQLGYEQLEARLRRLKLISIVLQSL